VTVTKFFSREAGATIREKKLFFNRAIWESAIQ